MFTDDGIALRRGISGRQCKFLRREEVAAAGCFAGSGTHVAYDAGAASLYPHMQLVAREYNAPELFVYFSVAQPKGFGSDAVLPLLRDGRNIFFNLGGGDFCALENIKQHFTAELLRRGLPVICGICAAQFVSNCGTEYGIF